ncbi:MAG: sulfurtransferase TusA family protein [Alkaliphilus sp.]
MNIINVDVRGRSCTEPVIMTKQAINNLNKSTELHILLDSNVAKENVKRLLSKEGFKIEVKNQDSDFIIMAQGV